MVGHHNYGTQRVTWFIFSDFKKLQEMDSCDETTLTNPSQKGKSKKESIDFWFKKPT